MNKIKNGWLSQARKVISPHFDERPDVEDISLLVIHYISLPPEQFGGGYVDDFFQGKFDDRAWHAGLSCFEGRDKCNDFAIGIELEGSNEQPFTAEQYQVLAALTRDIMQAYPKITLDRIVGHCDISPGRKIDPGQYFEWKRYFALVKKGLYEK